MTAATGHGQLLARRYRLEGLVGYGGAGTVWRAMDLVLERMLAVKYRLDLSTAVTARFTVNAP
jgi:hypothetical protein